MSDDRIKHGRIHPARESDWERAERRSFRIALAIALVPIPASLLISWALGSPPWRARPATAPGKIEGIPADPGRPVPSKAHGHR